MAGASRPARGDRGALGAVRAEGSQRLFLHLPDRDVGVPGHAATARHAGEAWRCRSRRRRMGL